MPTPKKFAPNTVQGIERKVEIACKRMSIRGLDYLEKLVERALADDAIDPNVVLKAINEIFNRGFGKPRQQVDQNINIKGGDALVEAINQQKMKMAERAMGLPEETAEKPKLN